MTNLNEDSIRRVANSLKRKLNTEFDYTISEIKFNTDAFSYPNSANWHFKLIIRDTSVNQNWDLVYKAIQGNEFLYNTTKFYTATASKLNISKDSLYVKVKTTEPPQYE